MPILLIKATISILETVAFFIPIFAVAGVITPTAGDATPVIKAQRRKENP